MEFTSPADDQPVRVAVIADGIGPPHPMTRTLAQLRERPLPGYALELVPAHGTAEALFERRFHLVHICGPSPVATLLTARGLGLPVAASYHARQDPGAAGAAFYGRCDAILSPGSSADASLMEMGIAPQRILRWEAGVDCKLFNPARYAPEALGIPDTAREPSTFNLLYAGGLGVQDGIELLVESFLIAHDRDQRLHLVLAGHGGPPAALRARLGRAATVLGPVEVERLARVYASADLFVFPGSSDTFGLVILEAQASGLPVLAVDTGAAAELIESGRSGCLAPADPAALASTLRGLARRAAVLDRLATGGLLAVRERSCERSLDQLAQGYAITLGVAERGETAGSDVAEVPRAA